MKLPRGFFWRASFQTWSRLAYFVGFQGWNLWCVSLRISSCSFGSCPMSCSFRIDGEGQRNSEPKRRCYPILGGCLKILKAFIEVLELEQFGQIDLLSPKKNTHKFWRDRFNLNLTKTRDKKGVIPAFRMQRYVKVTVATRLNSFKPQYLFFNRERCVLYSFFGGI